MNQHQLSIEALFRPEIVERILRVVRHRGFRICRMNAEQPPEGNLVSIEMTVASLRPIELLSVQLTKLPDVTSVRVLQPITQQTAQQTTQHIHAEA